MKLSQLILAAVISFSFAANALANEEQAAKTPPVAGKHCGGGMMHNSGMRMMHKRKMMAMRQKHMQKVEQHMTNIERLMQELVDLQKAKAAK